MLLGRKKGSTHLISCNVFNGEFDSLDDSSRYLSTFTKRFCGGWAYSSGCVEGLESSLELWLFKAPTFIHKQMNHGKKEPNNTNIWIVIIYTPTNQNNLWGNHLERIFWIIFFLLYRLTMSVTIIIISSGYTRIEFPRQRAILSNCKSAVAIWIDRMAATMKIICIDFVARSCFNIRFHWWKPNDDWNDNDKNNSHLLSSFSNQKKVVYGLSVYCLWDTLGQKW